MARLPIELKLVSDVKACRACGWFWKGALPYGPYPAYDFATPFPPEVAAPDPQSTGFVPMTPWLTARTTGARPVEPGVMHGCRKAPIMTLGINPNMTAWFPYTSGARWVYP